MTVPGKKKDIPLSDENSPKCLITNGNKFIFNIDEVCAIDAEFDSYIKVFINGKFYNDIPGKLTDKMKEYLKDDFIFISSNVAINKKCFLCLSKSDKIVYFKNGSGDSSINISGKIILSNLNILNKK